jgi:hypothetical protein
MSIHATGWAAIGASATAIISVISNIYLARKSRSQMIDQAQKSFEQAAASLDVQRTSTARAAATFVADKRQKWIDELRDDVSLYVALTVEIVEGWRRVFSKLGNRWDENGAPTAPRDLEVYLEDVRKFAHDIRERDSLHAQALTATSPPDDAAVEAYVQKTAPSVPSSFVVVKEVVIGDVIRGHGGHSGRADVGASAPKSNPPTPPL